MVGSLLSALAALPWWLIYLFVASVVTAIAGVVLLLAGSRMNDGPD